MGRLAAGLAALLAVSGCEPAGRAYSYLQYKNVDYQITRSIMTITAGDGSGNARRYMDAERYAGCCRLGSISVHYPEGSCQTAREVARAAADCANLVAIRMDIEWSFDLEIRLVRIPDTITGMTYSVPLTRDRKLVFPIFLNERGEVRASWAPVIAHEMTEASMIGPRERNRLVMGDLFAGQFCLNTGTRWFRDGVSDRAGYIFGERLFPGRFHPASSGYRELAGARGEILRWANCADAPNHYAASAALVLEAEKAAGEYAVARVMSEAARERVPGGPYLRRAFERATGLKLAEYLEHYSTPWLGADLSDTRPDPWNPPLVVEGNEVAVSSVHPASPASRRGVAEGDVVLSVDGVTVLSARHAVHLLAARAPGDMVEMRVKRGDTESRIRVKLARWYPDKER